MRRLIVGLALLVTSAGLACDPAHAELVAYYAFSGNALDGSGHGNDGTPIGATLVADCAGTPNEAYSFDGSSSYILVNDSNSLRVQQITLMAEVYLRSVSDPSGEDAFFWKQYSGNDASYDLEIVAATRKLEFALNRGSSNPADGVVLSSSSLEFNCWHHVAATWDGVMMRVYIDGVLDASGPYSGIPLVYDAGGLGLGADFPQGVHFVDGVMDEMRIYNIALTEAEIAALMPDCGSSPVDRPTWGQIKGHYR